VAVDLAVVRAGGKRQRVERVVDTRGVERGSLLIVAGPTVQLAQVERALALFLGLFGALALGLGPRVLGLLFELRVTLCLLACGFGLFGLGVLPVDRC
jgi:hypothetical protein